MNVNNLGIIRKEVLIINVNNLRNKEGGTNNECKQLGYVKEGGTQNEG